MTVEQFLEWEADEGVRHQFVDGEVFLMAGAEDRHVTVAGNIYMALRRHLRGTPCKVFMADMRLIVAKAKHVYYPDVLVTCSAADLKSRSSKSEPKLVVEVLSRKTAAFDRGEKFTAYRTLESLEEYVLVDPKSRRSDVYRKGSEGLWVLHPVAAGELLALASVGLDVDADELFADVDGEA